MKLVRIFFFLTIILQLTISSMVNDDIVNLQFISSVTLMFIYLPNQSHVLIFITTPPRLSTHTEQTAPSRFQIPTHFKAIQTLFHPTITPFSVIFFRANQIWEYTHQIRDQGSLKWKGKIRIRKTSSRKWLENQHHHPLIILLNHRKRGRKKVAGSWWYHQ